MRKFGSEDMCDPLEMGTGGEGRLPQVFCGRSGDEIEGLDLEEQRERGRFTVSSCVFLTSVCLLIFTISTPEYLCSSAIVTLSVNTSSI